MYTVNVEHGDSNCLMYCTCKLKQDGHIYQAHTKYRLSIATVDVGNVVYFK